MLPANDGQSNKGGDLSSRPLCLLPLPREVLADEKEIEAMFRDLVAGSFHRTHKAEMQGEQALVRWICVGLLCFLSVLGLYLLYLKARQDCDAFRLFCSHYQRKVNCIPSSKSVT